MVSPEEKKLRAWDMNNGNVYNGSYHTIIVLYSEITYYVSSIYKTMRETWE